MSTAAISEGQVLTGVMFNEPMRVITKRQGGAGTVIAGLVGQTSGQFREVTLTEDDIARLTAIAAAASYDGDGDLLKLALQAYSLGIAQEFDPYFGLSISRVDPLPHQLEAVYEYFMKLPSVRFLLADDAGAGKTIMAGLLIRELKLRGLVERILIVCPANLTFQWQRELHEKFDQQSFVMRGGDVPNQFGMNQWLDQTQVVTSLDLAKRSDILPGLEQVHWDLVIIDEAHRMSASDESHKSLRYRLGEKLRDSADNILLLTATPHKGAPKTSPAFLQLLRKAGADGYRIHHQATLRKAVADLRVSLDEETEVKPAIRRLVQQESDQGSRIRKVYFPEDSNAVGDDPRMTLVVVSPEEEWRENGPIAEKISRWTRERGRSPRLYPAALVWCIRKPGRDLQDKVELWLAWQKVRSEIDAGTMGPEFERPALNAVSQQIRSAEEEAVEEVKTSYRFVALGDSQAGNGLKTIDLGAGYSRGGPTLSERVVAALNSNALLNESVGVGYIERNWPPALQESGAWPMSSLRQSFLNGSLTRLLDPNQVLRQKIMEFVERGDFGLASGEQGQGNFRRVWYQETPAQDEVTFDSSTFLITKKASERAQAPPEAPKPPAAEPEPWQPDRPAPAPEPAPAPPGVQQPMQMPQKATLRLKGTVPPESWNMMGIRILTKLQSGAGLNLAVDLSVEVDSETLPSLRADIL